MPVALQIRNVPEAVRDTLAAQAEREGKSLQVYLLELLLRESRMLKNPDIFDRTAASRIRIPDHLAPELIIREGRDAGLEADRSDSGE